MTLTAAAAVATGCAHAGGAVSAEPRAVISQASGDLVVTNSLHGQAILQAQSLAPGQSVSGTVLLSNTGTLSGALGLEQLDVSDQPGTNGGRLSDAVMLDIQDVTSPTSPVSVFSGPLAALQTRALGALDPGQARLYRFVASLPDGGDPPSPTGGDNAYLGSALTVRYSWRATVTGGNGGGGSGSGTGGGTGGEVVVPAVKFRVVAAKVLKRGVLKVVARCDRACRLTAWAQLPKAKKRAGKGKKRAGQGKKRAGKALKTRPKSVAVQNPAKAVRIKLKLSKKTKRALKAALRRKRRVVLRVTVTVRAVSGGPSKSYTRKVKVKRKRKRGRR